MTGPQLRIIRECAGISQLKLAQMLKTSQTWISRFERGLSLIPEEIAEKVALALPKATLEAQTAKTEEIRARERWQKKTDAYLKEHHRGGSRKESVESGNPESTDRENVSGESTSGVDPAGAGFEKSVITEVRMCSTVELGPETLRAIKDMIETAVRELVKVKSQAPVTIRPEVINAKRDGDRYRAQSTGMSGRGW